MFNHIDFKSGTIKFLDNSEYLKEDLLQVEYPNGFIIDVGWYGEKNGFIVNVIKDSDWENPVGRYAAVSKSEMFHLVIKSIIEVEGLCSTEDRQYDGSLGSISNHQNHSVL